MAFVGVETINASQGLPAYLSYANQVTYGWFANMILISIYIITLIVYSMKTKDVIGGFASAGFGTFLIGLLLFLGEFIDGSTFAIVISFSILGAAALFIGRR